MGTPAFPDLGKHCTVDECQKIDFLPFTCDCCQKVFCLEHRSYNTHKCPNANKHDLTVVICPLCAKGVHLIPNEDPNISWESHVNTDCDPSNYENATKKKKCPVKGCREKLTFSNTIKCRDCTIDHCLKHRFGSDHTCPGPKKPDPIFGFLNMNMNKNSNIKSLSTNKSNKSNWASSFAKAASSVRASAEAGIAKISSEFNQMIGPSQSSGTGEGTGGGVEQCPRCGLRFSNVKALVDHVEKDHDSNGRMRSGVMRSTVDVCPKCSKGFRDPVALVEHVEKDHHGSS